MNSAVSIAIVIDDDPRSLQSISSSILDPGLKVVGFSSVSDGIAFAKESVGIELAIVDVQLEYSSDLSLIDVLTEHHEGAFVVLTGDFPNGGSLEHLDALAAVSGASVVLKKPVTADSLLKAIKSRSL